MPCTSVNTMQHFQLYVIEIYKHISIYIYIHRYILYMFHFDLNFTEVYSLRFNSQYTSIGSSNYLELNKPQAIPWNNDDTVHKHVYIYIYTYYIYATSGPNVFIWTVYCETQKQWKKRTENFPGFQTTSSCKHRSKTRNPWNVLFCYSSCRNYITIT